MKRILPLAFLFFLALSPLMAQSLQDRALESLLAREWQRLNAEQPILAIYLGEPSLISWPDNRREKRVATYERYKEVLAELDTIDTLQLSEQNQVNLRLFRQQLTWQLSLREHELDLFSMNQREGLHTLATLADSIEFKTLADYEAWVERLEDFSAFTDREISVLQEAIEKKRVQSRIIVQRMVEVVSVQPGLHSNPVESPFYAPFLKANSEQKGEPAFQKLAERARVAITSQVKPSFERLTSFLQGPYQEAAPQRVGLGQLPGGDAAYQFLIQRYTTTDLSAEQIHQLGLSEVSRIRSEMEKIKRELGFQGSLEDFFTQLRSDEKHYLKDPEELLQRYRAFCKRVDGQMPRFFKTLPRKPYGVEAIPDYVAPATTTAYYMPGAGHLSGTYCVNLYKPETRALFEIPALSLHEAVPGHHHQIALAQELPALPAFRRESAGFGDYTVFVEGWALYAESLGEEMGLYQDPYDRFGRYTYEIWRAIRLVLDTGIHNKGWSREEAIEYFLSNSPRSELDITNEVDRYISWPGQALAYKMGELEIQKQRRRAELELGEKFDLAEFHDVVLRQGAVPVEEIVQQVTDYIESSKL